MMPRRRLVEILGLGLAAACSCSAGAATLSIDTGRIAGERQGEVTVFKGIPYAAAPVGALRWRAPQAPPSWRGVRATKQFGSACLQPQRDSVAENLGAPISEDCLYLNVWRPGEGEGPWPVMVWIHGGALTHGAASTPQTDGAAIAARGIVFVSFNYRLGYLGFFSHPALTREAADGGQIANYGLMDQVAALRWVKRNIRAFGGDPSRVTVFGESAGAFSIQLLMVSPPARGLFDRAIIQSGYYRGSFPRLDAVAPDGRASAQSAGIAALDAIGVKAKNADELRGLTVPQLQAMPQHGFSGAVPAIDGRYVTDDLWPAWRAGKAAPVPIIVGATALETPALPPSIRARVNETLLKFISLEEQDGLVAAYGGPAAFDEHFSSDFSFAALLYSFARMHRAHGHPAYRYRFGALPESAANRFRGLPHAGELPYVFGTLEHANWPMQGRDREISRAALDYWTAFARGGVPAPPDRTAWPLADDDQIMLFDNDGARAIIDDRAPRYRAAAAILDPRS
ncbi:MAG: carboxylesterase family protein [Steroidobacteraceae bacterium]